MKNLRIIFIILMGILQNTESMMGPYLTSSRQILPEYYALIAYQQQRNLRDYTHLKGLLRKFKSEQVEAAPLAGAVFLRTDLGLRWYKEPSARGQFIRSIFHDLDDQLRVSALPGNPLSSITPEIAASLQHVATKKVTSQDFLESDIVTLWHEKHSETKKDLKLSSFKKLVKRKLKELEAIPSKDASIILSAAGCFTSNTKEDLARYAEIFLKQKIETSPEEGEIEIINLIANNKFEDLIINHFSGGYKGQESISLCVEQSLWTFINLIFYNQKTEQFDHSLINQDVQISHNLKQFLETHTNPHKSSFVENAQQDFINLVSGIPHINYHKNKDYELTGSPESVLQILNHLFNTSETSLEYFGQKISTKKHTVQIHKKQENNYSVTINSIPTVHWKLYPLHASIDTKELEENRNFNIDRFIRLIQKYPDLYLAALTPAKIITTTIDQKDVPLLKLLLNHGANPNVKNECNIVPLHQAVEKENYELVKLLLEHGANPNVKNRWNKTPLHEAIKIENYKLVKLLLEHGANPNLEDWLNNTPLFQAIRNENYELVKLLLEHRADPNKKNSSGFTPLDHCLSNNNLQILLLLCRY